MYKAMEVSSEQLPLLTPKGQPVRIMTHRDIIYGVAVRAPKETILRAQKQADKRREA